MDFYDKLVIAITFVIVTFICLLNNFCFASSYVPSSTANETGFNSNASAPAYGKENVIQKVSGYNGVYFPVSAGVSYKLEAAESSNMSNNIYMGFTSDVPAYGVSIQPYLYDFSPSFVTSFSFRSPVNGYLLVVQNTPFCYFSLTQDDTDNSVSLPSSSISSVNFDVNDIIDKYYKSEVDLALSRLYNSYNDNKDSVIWGQLVNYLKQGYIPYFKNYGSSTDVFFYKPFNQSFNNGNWYLDGSYYLFNNDYQAYTLPCSRVYENEVLSWKISLLSDGFITSFNYSPTFLTSSTGSKYWSIPTSICNYYDNDIQTFIDTITGGRNSSTSAIVGSIEDSSNETQNTIKDSSDKINNTISSTDYDEDTVNIDTSSTDIDDSSSTELFTTIFTNFKNLLDNSNWQTVETIDIPIPHSDKNIQLKSNILSSIVGSSFIATLINVAWYSIFGLYAFKFSTKIYHSIKSGDILTGLNLDDEVITSSMM